MSGRATESGSAKTVEIWVEQLSGPARALKNAVESAPSLFRGIDIKIREKHLPDLESDTLDLLVFEGEIQKPPSKIVLAYAPSLRRIERNSCPTGTWLEKEIRELMEEAETKGLGQRQDFLLKELGREASGKKVKYLPLMANTMVFVWNKSQLRRVLTRGTPLPDPPPLGNQWKWNTFFDLLRTLSEQGSKYPLAMCGSPDGALAYYEWCNFIGGSNGNGSVLFDRTKAPHGWESPNVVTQTMRRVLDDNRQHLARFVRVLQRYAHPAFLDIDQELQLDLILRGDAVGGFVWADRLAGLDAEEIDHLGIWPIPGDRSIVSGAVALAPKDIGGRLNGQCEDIRDDMTPVLQKLWKVGMMAKGFVPANLPCLRGHVDRIVENLTSDAGGRPSRERNSFLSENQVFLREHPHVDGMDRLLLAVYEALTNRKPIVLEGGKYAHRIAECFSAATGRIWKRLQQERSSISDIVNAETRILQHEMEDRFSPGTR